jgi:hypothetical protein
MKKNITHLVNWTKVYLSKILNTVNTKLNDCPIRPYPSDPFARSMRPRIRYFLISTRVVTLNAFKTKEDCHVELQ